MNTAIFFQKYDRNIFVKIIKKLYFIFFLRSYKSRLKYLRDSGAKIGTNTHIGSVGILGTEPCLVEIGNNVYFSGNKTQIITHDGSISKTFDMGIAPKRFDIFGKVKIGNNVFIGVNCIILKNVEIGDNCIIGAGSIVTKNIPSGSVACGVPARVICTCQDYYDKNMNNLHDTAKWNTYKKRVYLESNLLN